MTCTAYQPTKGTVFVILSSPFFLRRVPAYYALILRSLTVLEGLALQADSEYKLLA